MATTRQGKSADLVCDADKAARQRGPESDREIRLSRFREVDWDGGAQYSTNLVPRKLRFTPRDVMVVESAVCCWMEV